MNIEKTARRIVDLNAPSPELLESTLRLMREAHWAGQQDAPRRKKKHVGLRRFGFSTVAAALMMALLIGTNALFPAFAESLPLVGSIFRQYNRAGKVKVGSYVGTYGKVEEISAPALAAQTQELALTAQEAYSDGEYIHVAFTMEAPQEYLDKYYYLAMPLDSTVNGEAQAQKYVLLWPAETRFEGTLALHLDEYVQNGQKLAVGYETQPILGYLEGGAEYEDVSGTFSGSLEVTADTTDNRILDGFRSDGDVKILNFDATPSRTTITYEIPYWGQDAWHTDYPQLFTEDGIWIERSSKYDSSDYDVYQADTITSTWDFDSLPAGTDKIILRFFNYDPYNSLYYLSHPEEEPYEDHEPWVDAWRQDGAPMKAGVLREVTVDLNTLEVTPTETYKDVGIPTCFDHFTNYLHLNWSIVFDDYFLRNDVHNASYDMIFADESVFQNGYCLEVLDYAKESQTFTLKLLSTHDDSKDLDVVITGEDGKNVAVGCTVSNSKQEMESSGQYRYGMLVKSMIGREPELMDHMTITLSDPDTGEQLYQTTVRLVRKEWRDMYFG